MVLKGRKIFAFLSPAAAALAGGLSNEWFFLVFSLVCAVFFIYEKEYINPTDPWFAYFVWLVFASFFSHAPVLSIFTAFKWFIFYLFYSYFKKHGDTEIKKIFISSVLTVSFVCAAILLSKYRISWHYNFGVIGKNRNYTSLILMISSVYFFYSYFKQTTYRAGVLRLLGTAFFLFPVIILNSRGILACLFASYAVILLLFGKKRLFFYSLLLITAAVILLPRSLIEHFLKLDEAGSYMRPYLWKSALKGALEYPVTGYGPGLFENIFSLFKFRHFDGISFFNHTTLHAHSEPLNIAAEAGFTGLALFLFAFYKTMTSRSADPDSTVFKIFAAAVFFHGLVDIIFFLPMTGFLFLSFCGLAENHPPSPPARKHSLPLYPALLLFLAGIVPFFFYLQQSRKMLREDEYGAFFRTFEKAPVSLQVLRKGVEFSIPNSLRIEAISFHAAARHPHDVFFLYEMARCSYFGGDIDRGERLLKKALFLEPAFKRARLLLAEILLARGEKYKAAKNLRMLKEDTLLRPVKKNEDFYNLYLLDFDLNIYKNLEKRLGRHNGPV